MPFPQNVTIPKTLMLTPKTNPTYPTMVVVTNITQVQDLGPGNGSKILFNTGASLNQYVEVEETVAFIFASLN